LPAGTDWYNFWTNERVEGGRTITVAAPIDTIPLFVRAGSIIPLGAPVENTHQVQAIAQVRVYPGADGSFTLFSDDGTTYAYEKGASSITQIHWDDAKQMLTRDGAAGWSEPDSAIVKIAGK
jgi:alpha-glucosidase (family GH31 glycosyl hydrolase)